MRAMQMTSRRLGRLALTSALVGLFTMASSASLASAAGPVATAALPTSWTGVAVDLAMARGFVMGKDGTHHILLDNAAQNGSMYATDAGGSWHVDQLPGLVGDIALDYSVDPNGSPVIVTRTANADPLTPVTVYTRAAGAWVADPISGLSGQKRPQVAVESDGDIDVAWDQSFRHKGAAGWDAVELLPDTIFPYVGDYGGMDLVVDHDDTPHVLVSGSYSTAIAAPCDDPDVRVCLVDYAADGAGGWTAHLVAKTEGLIRATVATNGDIMGTIFGNGPLAWFRGSGSTWTYQAVAGVGSGEASIDDGPSGPVIFYTPVTGGFQRADHGVSGWTSVPFGPTTGNWIGGIIDDTDGSAHVVYTHETYHPDGYTIATYLAAPDKRAPTVSAPIARPHTGSVMGTTVPTTVSWSASDALSGLDHYLVQQKTGSGAWATVSSTVTARSITRNLVASTIYQFRIRGWDKAGNATPIAYGTAFRLLRYEGSSTLVKPTGTWKTLTTSVASGGSTRYATTKNASVSMTVTGSGFAWIAPKGKTSGSARVYIDGAWITDVSLYRSTTLSKTIVYSVRWATSGTHTIKVVVLGTAGHSRVDLDAFIVTR